MKIKQYEGKNKTCNKLIVLTNLIISFIYTSLREISQCPSVCHSACHQSSLNMAKFDIIFRRREGKVINQDPSAYIVKAVDIGEIFG
jgi:hypothetical protein